MPLDSLELPTPLQRAASQEEREIAGPIRNVVGFALLVMIQSLLTLSLLAAYVFLHRVRKNIETPPEGKPRSAAV